MRAAKLNRLKKLEVCAPKLVSVMAKYQKFIFFSKLKYKPEVLNETIIVDQTMYETRVGAADYEKQLEL